MLVILQEVHMLLPYYLLHNFLNDVLLITWSHSALIVCHALSYPRQLYSRRRGV